MASPFPGVCAELVKAPAHVAFRVPDSLPRTRAPLAEPLSCTVHGFDQIGVQLAVRYLIFGAGTIGLLLAQLALRAGAGEMALVDTNEHRREQARKLLSLPVVASADELDQPDDWDVVMDATGAVPAIEDGLRRVGRGGTFLVFGVTSADAETRFSPFRIYNDEIRIMGSMAVLHSFERALALAATGAVDGDALVTHRVPLDDYLEAVELVRRGEGLKVLVTPGRTG